MTAAPRFRFPTHPGLLALPLLAAATGFAAELRVGLIGLDTSHAVAFAKLLNDPASPEHVPGAKVVAAFRAPSPDIPSSMARVDRFVAELKKDPAIVFYDSIPELLRHVDAVMIESVDGRAHLAQAKQVFSSGKPVFIDKPLAGTLRDAFALAAAAQEAHAAWFSGSSLRETTRTALAGAAYGELRGAFAYGPAELEPHHPDLFWYGIHAVESLYTVMGPGCISVVRTHSDSTDVVTGTWPGGRIGSVRGTRNAKSLFGVTVFGSTAVVTRELKVDYRGLVADVVNFFATGVAPVGHDETLEILAFMAAADESKRRGGAPVTLAEVMAANRIAPAAGVRQ